MELMKAKDAIKMWEDSVTKILQDVIAIANYPKPSAMISHILYYDLYKKYMESEKIKSHYEFPFFIERGIIRKQHTDLKPSKLNRYTIHSMIFAYVDDYEYPMVLDASILGLNLPLMESSIANGVILPTDPRIGQYYNFTEVDLPNNNSYFKLANLIKYTTKPIIHGVSNLIFESCEDIDINDNCTLRNIKL